MADSLRTRIAAVLATHAVAQYSWGPEGCSCDYRLDISDEDHPFHQADAVIRELGDLKTLIAEAIYNSEYNLRYHRIDMWGAYQYADAILKALPKDTE